MDDVEIIIPDEISESFLQSRRESAEKRDSDENQENIKKNQLKFKKRLVHKVRQQRALYDTNFKGFSNTNAKENAWQQIAKELGKEVDACKNSWVDLRYLYQRHVRRLRKFFASGNKNQKRRPVMAFEQEMMFLWRYIADRSRLPKPRAQKLPTPTIDCDDDDVVLLDDEEPVIVIDVDENDSPTKTHPESKSQSKGGSFEISPEVRRLVEALQEYPELYDFDNRYFGDYRRKGILWNALANELKDKATKLMKLWVYLQTRYEWEINHSTVPEEESELKKLLSFLKPCILKNSNTVYKQCFYTKQEWQEPIEHFKNIFQLLVVIRKHPNIVNYTDDYLLSAKKENDYLSSWVEISKTRGATPGQCEITWLIMRFFYWELMHMRQHTYQLQDKWYFEGIISELYLHAKPYLDPQKTAESEEMDIYANSYATTTPIPIDLEANIDATCIYNNPENSHYKTFTENSTPMFPKITSAKSLHVSAQSSFGVQQKHTGFNSFPGVPATIRPVFPQGISLVPTTTTVTLTNITQQNMLMPLNKETTISLKPKPKSSKAKIVLRQKPIAPKIPITTSLPMPPLQPLSTYAPSIISTGPALTMVSSLPAVTSFPHVVPSLPVMPSLPVVPALPEVPFSSGVSSLPSIPFSSGVSSLPSIPLLPPLPSVSALPSPPLISTITSPPSVSVQPSAPLLLPSVPSLPTLPSLSSAVSSLSSTVSLPSPVSLSSPVLLSSPQPQPPLHQPPKPSQPQPTQPSANNLAPLPKITGALSLLNPNEIMIELVATPNGNQLLVHGPPLSEKYSLSMPTTAKFIREIMAIPRLHNKMIHPSGTNLYWQYLSKKFGLPIHICKACWNFLADNFTHFNQIAPMDELMKPFKTWFKVWKESTVLFRNFESLAVERGWLKYQNELPLLMNELSNHQDILETVSPHKDLFPIHIRSKFPHIHDIWDMCNAFKNVFVAYMSELERGVDNKWPMTWWRVLVKLKFLLEKRYKDTEPFYYIIRNKINEEIIRCAQNETNTKTEEELPPPSSDVKAGLLGAELTEKILKKENSAAGSSKKTNCNESHSSFDPYHLMVSIREHPNIYTSSLEWQKKEAWKAVAKKMNSSVMDCRSVFIRLVKDYRNFLQRDPRSRCRLNEKYFKPLKEIYQSLQTTTKLNIKTPSELNLSVDFNSKNDQVDKVLHERFIGDINMENAKPSLVLKNWAFSIGYINNFSQRTTSLDGQLQSLFDKYRRYCF